ncbi:MAG TPA: histidine phosphatase family protein [Rhodocyclaceae bacterium]
MIALRTCWAAIALWAGLLPFAAQAQATAEDALWRQIAGGGYVLLIRHAATEPGFGDPPQFRLGDCSTQRNLSAAGRDEARRLGEMFLVYRVPVAEVRSSPWCRCVDTAKLAFGKATVWDALASLYFDDRDEAARRQLVVEGARAFMARGVAGNFVLVTHNFNIRSLLGVSPAQAEVIVARLTDEGLELVGRLPPP